jgi:hypothetical protein
MKDKNSGPAFGRTFGMSKYSLSPKTEDKTQTADSADLADD